TDTDDCVRPGPCSRAARQLGQPQFHWGSPPPAAEPRMMTRIEKKEAGIAPGLLKLGSSTQRGYALPAYAPTSMPSSTTSNSGFVHDMLQPPRLVVVDHSTANFSKQAPCPAPRQGCRSLATRRGRLNRLPWGSSAQGARCPAWDRDSTGPPAR